MMNLRVRINEQLQQKLEEAAKTATFRNFGHAMAAIRKTAQGSIERAAKEPRQNASRKRKRRRAVPTIPSPPGSPPRTRRGQLKRAIRFDVTETSAVAGPIHTIVGESAAAHEFGGTYKGAEYPERKFMGPALEQNVSRFAESWRSSIGE